MVTNGTTIIDDVISPVYNPYRIKYLEALMMKTNNGKTNIKRKVVLFRLFAFSFAFLGVLETTGFLRGQFDTVTLFAYTTQSNMLVIIFFGVLLIKSIGFKVTKSSVTIKSFGFYPRL